MIRTNVRFRISVFVILTGVPELVNAMSSAAIKLPRIVTVYGVDFSGAAQSGHTAWMAELANHEKNPLELVRLGSLGRFAGSVERADVCRYLVDKIRASKRSLWGCDFPFGLPIELGLGCWQIQLDHVLRFSGTAKDYGRELVAITQRKTGNMHVRRVTDRETKTPFDCYHYRIIHQTFHGMREVLAPLADDPQTVVLPFQYAGLATAQRVVLEACPSSTLKRMQLPHRLYKQTGGKPPEATHHRTRQQILRGIAPLVKISAYHRRVIMQNSGGDALDAVLAGLGSWHSYQTDNHDSIAAHERYPTEGRVYC